MLDYMVFREDLQADTDTYTWGYVGRVMAEDPHAAVKTVNAGSLPQWGTYVAIPAQEYLNFVGERTLVLVKVNTETVELGSSLHAYGH